MKKRTFYITTTLPYVNAEPHIGFGLEIVAADVIARYHKLLGEDVVFNTGTDEHGQKIYEKALENNQDPQKYADFWAGKFENLRESLDLDYTHFIRTTDFNHMKAAQEFWRRCDTNGYIYKKMYQIKYCVGCELEKQDNELVDGCCPLHPSKKLEERAEENYFFKFSEFEKKLLDFYETNPEFVQPEGKFKEIKSFVTSGLKDFSISRLKTKMPWGVEVPGDPEHVMYVWFDALVNYVSTLGWPEDSENFEKYWGTKSELRAVQIAGKDNLRQQSAMWQAMLMAADLPNSKQILINGFISIDGQKMSKSLGNVISPTEMVERYGTDGTRFLLMFLGPVGGDMDISWEKLDTIYTAHLANGLGNLCSRVAKLCEKSGIIFDKNFRNQPITIKLVNKEKEALDLETVINKTLSEFDLKKAIVAINHYLDAVNDYFHKKEPWTLEKDKQKDILEVTAHRILNVAEQLKPFMPNTAKKIIEHFSTERITALKPLFPRIEVK